MTKNTLLAIAAFAASIAATAKILSGEAPEGDLAETPATDEKPARRGRGPAKQLETPPAEEKTPPAKEKKPPAKEKKPAEDDPIKKLKDAAQPIIEEGGMGQKVKDWLDKHDVKRISDIPVEHHAAFLAEMKRLKAEVEANLM